MGIEIQKEWVCTHDDRTRPSHLELDGERRDLDEEFSNGLQYPGDPDGDPSEVYNCRCTLVAYLPELDEDTEGTSAEGYDEWVTKESASQEASGQETKLTETQSTVQKTSARDYTVEKTAIAKCDHDSFNQKAEKFGAYTKEIKKNGKVVEKVTVYPMKDQYYPTHKYAFGLQPTEEQIIRTVGRYDWTGGSCMSQALAYIGQKFGVAVEDLRGGYSMKLFQDGWTLDGFIDLTGQGVKYFSFTPLEDFWDEIKNALAGKMHDNEEWIVSAGPHTAIVKRTGKTYKYLELQEDSHATKGVHSNGWHSLTQNSLQSRFGVNKTNRYGQYLSMMPIEALRNYEEFYSRLGWLNTADYIKYYGKVMGEAE